MRIAVVAVAGLMTMWAPPALAEEPVAPETMAAVVQPAPASGEAQAVAEPESGAEAAATAADHGCHKRGETVFLTN